MRVCIVYDCLYPWTVGGGERWLTHLARRLAERGHEVTYLTRRQWERGDEPAIPGVRVVAVSPFDELYDDAGHRRFAPPLKFGRGVLGHLLRHRRDYDVVHCAAFPYFSLPAARIALAGSRTRLFADWFELWGADYWRRYVGGPAGAAGRLVQAACVRLSPASFAISPLTARRLRAAGASEPVITLPGLYTGPTDVAPALEAAGPPTVVFAGRLIPEKRAHLIPGAVAAASARMPGLRARILGSGPERERVLEEIRRHGVEDRVEAPGVVEQAELDAALRGATCLILPSSREGYGIVVVEAAAAGTPVVVVAGEDNAAVDLIAPGVNGFVAEGASPEPIADAIVAAHEGGPALRARTAKWFAESAAAIHADAACEAVLRAYSAAC